MTEPLSFADKLLILGQTGRGLMARVHMLRNFSLPDELMKDTKEHFDLVNKYFQEFQKRWDTNLKDHQKEDFQKKSTEIRTQLETYYRTFVDCMNWCSTTILCLKQFNTEHSHIPYKNNATLMKEYMELFILYAQIIYLIGCVPNRKGYLGFFKKAHDLHGNSEQSWSSLKSFICDYEGRLLWTKLREDMDPFTDRIAAILKDIQVCIIGWHNRNPGNVVGMAVAGVPSALEAFHKKNVFNVVDKSDKMHLTTGQEDHIEALYLRQFEEWTLWGYLLCPKALATYGDNHDLTSEAAVHALCMCLRETWALTICREETFTPQEEFLSLFKNFSCHWPPNQTKKKFKWSKHRKLFDAIMNDPDTTVKARAEFRTYLRCELETMLAFFKAFPHCLSPKIHMVAAICAMAKWELETYFKHHIVRPSAKAKKLVVPFDPYLAHLVHHVQDARDLLAKHSEDIHKYYFEYLRCGDLEHWAKITEDFNREAGAGCSETLKGLFARVSSDIQSAQLDANFAPVRINCYRIHAGIIRTENQISPAMNDKVGKVVDKIIYHSRFVDSLQYIGRLETLFWYSEQLEKALDQALFPSGGVIRATGGPVGKDFHLPSVGQAGYAMNIIRILSDGIENMTALCPEDDPIIGKRAFEMTRAFMSRLVHAIEARIIRRKTDENGGGSDGILVKLRHLRLLAGPMGVTMRLQQMMNPNANQGKMPGAESQWKYRFTRNLKGFNQMRKEAYELCRSIERYDKITVYQYEFNSREYLHSLLTKALRNHLTRCVRGKSGNNIKRPSEILNEWIDVISSWQFVASHSRIDLSIVIKKVLCEQMRNETVGGPGQAFKIEPDAAWEAKGWTDEEHHKSPIQRICSWYSSMFETDLSQTLSASYSPTVRAFVHAAFDSNVDMSDQIIFGEYTDPCELEALCVMIGPQGLKCLDRELLSIIGERVANVRRSLEQNQATLINFHPGTELVVWNDYVGRLLDFDNFTENCVLIGCVLQFRELLRSAMGRVLKKDMPFLQSCVGMTVDAIPRVNRPNAAFNDVNRLASDFGLDVGEADPALQAELLKQRGNPQVWNLLPAAFSVTFKTRRWETAKYSVRLDGHLNNAHMMNEAVSALISAYTRISTPDDIKADEKIQASFEDYVRMSANSLLHMMNQCNGDQNKVWQIRNMMVVLEKFILGTPRLGLSLLDDCFPYTLCRTNYVALYEDEDKSSAFGCADEENKEEEEKKE